MAEKNINVAKLDDLNLRKSLIQAGLLVGPVNSKKSKQFHGDIYYIFRFYSSYLST